MTRATLGRSRPAFRFTIERLRTMLLIGGGLLVAAIAIFLAAGQWKLRKAFQDIPGRLGVNIEQSADGVNYTQTRKGKTIFRIHAAKAITRKTGGTTTLHDVKIDLYGDDGNRADTITGSEFEYDPNAGVATAAGAVEILMMRPGVKPAISTLKPSAPKSASAQSASAKPGAVQGKQQAASPVLGAITDDEIHIKTSGLTFNQKTGVATTEQRVDFALRQGSGNALGATYDSPNGHLILDHAVELMVARSGAGASSGPIAVHAAHAEFVHDAMECHMTQAHATYTGGSVETAQALMHFRDDGSISLVDGSDGVDLRTAAGSHVTAPTGTMAFDTANHPQHGLLTGGTRLEMNEPNRQVQGTAPTAQLTFDALGELTQAHLEQGVVFNSQQQVTTAKGEEAQVRRTWNSRTADVAFAPAAETAAKPVVSGKPQSAGHVEPRTIHGFGGVVVTSQTVAGGVAMPSRLAADTLVAELAPGGAMSSMHGEGHASFDERNAAGVHQATSADVLDVRFVPVAKSPASTSKSAGPASGARSQEVAGKSEIASLVEVGHVVLVQDPPPASQTASSPAASAQKANGSIAPSGIRATSNRADYDGATEILHLTGSPRVHDGAMDMTANVIDFARASGDAFAHGDVRASWMESNAASGTSVPGNSLLSGSAGPGGNGPIHAVAAEAELHQSSQEVVFRSAGGSGMPRLWQSVNSVSAPEIVLNRTKQTLVAEASGAAEPVRTVLVSQGGMGTGNASGAKPAKSSSPSVIRIRSGELHYSEAERIALFHSGEVGQVTAETTDTGGTSTIVSHETDVTLLPAGTHAASGASNTSIDGLTATGHVVIDWPGRHATGEKLVYRSEDGNYRLTGTSTAPPRVTDEVQGTVTGSALILHSGDDRVTVEGDGGKTVTETRSKK
jgi:lipopolysaccharide export system protein LptA